MPRYRGWNSAISSAENPVVTAKESKNLPASAGDFARSREYAHAHPITTRTFENHAGTAKA